MSTAAINNSLGEFAEDAGRGRLSGWLRAINQDPNNIRLMVDGFVNSQEYRLRFGQP